MHLRIHATKRQKGPTMPIEPIVLERWKMGSKGDEEVGRGVGTWWNGRELELVP